MKEIYLNSRARLPKWRRRLGLWPRMERVEILILATYRWLWELIFIRPEDRDSWCVQVEELAGNGPADEDYLGLEMSLDEAIGLAVGQCLTKGPSDELCWLCCQDCSCTRLTLRQQYGVKISRLSVN